MIAATETSLCEGRSSGETNSWAMATGAEPGRFGATTIAGSGVLVVQQFVLAELLDSDLCEQHLCPALCVRCRQVPNGASKVPINRMATAARWKTPVNMNLEYHVSWVLL